MTNDERVSALDLAQAPQDRKKSRDNPDGVNFGGASFKKADGRAGYASEVAAILYKNNGVYTWDVRDPLNGCDVFNNIYERMAADIHAPGASLRVRMEAAQAYEHEARSGLTTVAGWLLDQFNIPLYRTVSEEVGFKNKISIITVNPDLVVRSDGTTASQIQVQRDTKAIAGQVQASLARIGREKGVDRAREILADIVNGVISESSLPAPRRDLLDYK